MNRKFWKNVSSLFSVHFLNYVVPVLTLPYLARILGASSWGALALADSYAAYVSLLVEYCFGLSASRTIARVQDDREARSRHLSGVLLAQVLLATIAFLATFAAATLIPVFAPYRPLLPWSYALAVARAVMPAWYFQGLERMGIVAIPNAIVNLAAAAAIFLLVHGPRDTWIPLALRAAAAAVVSGITFYFAYQEVPLIRPTFSYARLALREGGSLFLFKSAASLFTTANVLILGFFAPAVIVGWYAGAEKIARAAINCIQPLSQSFYPRLSNQLATDPAQAAATLRLSARITIGLGFATGILLFTLAPILVRVALGSAFTQAVPVLRILAFLAPLAATTNVFGIQWMLALRLDSLFTRIVLGAGILNVVSAILLAPNYRHIGMAVSVVCADLFLALATLSFLKKKKLIPWSNSSRPVLSPRHLPRITVVTPSYNQVQFLRQALESVLNQNYPDLEYIVMDGGSSDGSEQLINEYSDRLSYWCSRKDNGQADAVRQGFARASGDVLCWLNSDDYFLPGALLAVGQYFRDHPGVEAVNGGAYVVDEYGSARLSGFWTYSEGVAASYRRFKWYGQDGVFQQSTFWRRSAYEAVGGVSSKFFFILDKELFTRLAGRHRFGVIRQLLACFRIHCNSKTFLHEKRRLEEEAQFGVMYRNKAWERAAYPFFYSWYRLESLFRKAVTAGVVKARLRTLPKVSAAT